MKISILFCVAFLFVGAPVVSQTDAGELNNSKMINVEGNIYMLQGRGGNIGLSFGADGTFMIDDQFAESVPDNLKAINRIKEAPIKFLINTHHHGDHTGGNIEIAKTGATIVSHENVRQRLLEIRNEKNKSGGKVDRGVLPLITFSDDLTFHFNGEEINIFHVENAHTDGDALVYFKTSNVLHTGDTYFGKKYPYIDTKSGGSLEGYKNSLEKVIGMINDDTKIIPGHGDIASRKDIIYCINMLSTLEKKVTVQARLKKTEDEVAAMTELTKNYDAKGYGDGFISSERILRMIYKEVSVEINEAIKQRERDLKDLKSYQDELKKKQKDGKGN